MLKRIQAGYALGNVMCDVVAVMQNTYFLLFLSQVIKLDPTSCGIVLAISRLLDCGFGLVAGFFVDRFAPFSRHIDRRKFWHLVGSLIIAMSLPLQFIPPPNHDIENVDTAKTMIYYLFTFILQCVGFAFSLITHLTVASVLAANDGDSVLLQSLKNGVTKLTFMVINLIGTFLLSVEEDENETEIKPINWSDRDLFKYLGICGSLASLLLVGGFHYLIKSSDLRGVSAIAREMNSSSENSGKKSTIKAVLKWFKRPPFYSFIVFYSLTWTMYLSLMSYQSFYIQITLAVDRRFVLLVPLIQNAVGFGISFGMKTLAQRVGKMVLYIIGCSVMLIVSAVIAIGHDAIGSETTIVYILAIGVGIGQSITLVQAFVSSVYLLNIKLITQAMADDMARLDKENSGIFYAMITTSYQLVTGSFYYKTSFICCINLYDKVYLSCQPNSSSRTRRALKS